MIFQLWNFHVIKFSGQNELSSYFFLIFCNYELSYLFFSLYWNFISNSYKIMLNQKLTATWHLLQFDSCDAQYLLLTWHLHSSKWCEMQSNFRFVTNKCAKVVANSKRCKWFASCSLLVNRRNLMRNYLCRRKSYYVLTNWKASN